MAFPSIKPIQIGRDGWSALYDTETSRLLFLCGLRARRITYNSKQRRTVIDWHWEAAKNYIIHKGAAK